VKSIGDEYENGDALEDLFEDQLEFGEVDTVTIRHRMDQDGRNTSWALVTMETTDGAAKALRADLPGLMTCSLFSEAKAAEGTASGGAAEDILKQHVKERKTKVSALRNPPLLVMYGQFQFLRDGLVIIATVFQGDQELLSRLLRAAFG